MKSSLATCGRVLPLVAACTTLVTVILCYSLTIGGDTYTGGLDWPYFSDTGRGNWNLKRRLAFYLFRAIDNPEYYIFAIGLTIVGLCMSIIWYANYIYQREALSAARRKETISDHISRIHIAANTLGVLSTIGLPLLSIFDTSTYPDLHFYASIWFVVLEAFAVLLNVSPLRILLSLRRLTPHVDDHQPKAVHDKWIFIRRGYVANWRWSVDEQLDARRFAFHLQMATRRSRDLLDRFSTLPSHWFGN